MSRKYKKRKIDQSCYAIYRGDEFVDLGTLDYLSKILNISRKTLQWLKSPTAMKRFDGSRNGLIVIKVDDGDNYEC